MAHAHTSVEVSLAARKRLLIAAIAAAAATALALVWLWPSDAGRNDVGGVGFAREVYQGRVTALSQQECVPGDGGAGTCRAANVEMESGPDAGSRVTIDLPVNPGRQRIALGSTVILAYEPSAQPQFQYSFADVDRQPTLVWLALLFAGAVIALGRLRGVAALAGLIASFVVLLEFVLPAVLQGESPVAVAVAGASAIAFVALYLAHGFRPMTTVALLGTLASLALTVLLADLFVGFANFSGFATEEATFLNAANTQIDLGGLMLGGIVIGALGAIDDMTVTQASIVWELRDADPTMSRRRLFGSAMRIGRNHVASTVNTLALAYAGASMPLLVLFVLSEQSLSSIVNGELIATEVVRTLVGSIGLVSSVPVTTWLAVAVLDGPGDRRNLRRYAAHLGILSRQRPPADRSA